MLSDTKFLSLEPEGVETVPKPSPKITAAPQKDKGVSASVEVLPKRVRSGKPVSAISTWETQPARSESTFKAAKEKIRQCVRELRQSYGNRLNRSQMIRIDQMFHRELIPKRKPGRHPLARITRAYEAYQSGQRGVALYREHIAGWRGMSRWRQRWEEVRLMSSIRSRERRTRTSRDVKSSGDEAQTNG